MGKIISGSDRDRVTVNTNKVWDRIVALEESGLSKATKEELEVIETEVTGLSTQLASKANKNMSIADIVEPFVIAHRGGAYVYPEGTMEGYKAIVGAGIRIIEPDVQTLSDGALAIFHDDTVDGKTTGTGTVAEHTAYSFQKLTVDASSWLGSGYMNPKPILFEELLREFKDTVIYVPESKDQKSAMKMVDAFKRHGLEKNAIISSYSISELTSVASAGIETMLATDSISPQTIVDAGIKYVGISTSATDSYVASLIAVGLKVVVYTINRRADFETWKAKGVVGCYSDDPLWISGTNTHKRTTDPFKHQVFYHGHIPTKTGNNRGQFDGIRWGYSTANVGGYDGVLQGWGCPLTQDAYSIQLTMTFDIVSDVTKWGSIAVCSQNEFFDDVASTQSNAYHILMRANGLLQLYKSVNGVGTKIAEVQTPTISQGSTAILKVDVNPTSIIVTRTDAVAPNTFTVNDTTHRGQYFFLGRGVNAMSFSNVSIT